MNPPAFERKNIGPRGSIDKFEPTIDGFRTMWPSVSGGGTFMHPFQLIDASTDLGAFLSVRYGTINDIVPTLSGTSLSDSPTLALTTVGTYLVYLEFEYDDEGVGTGAIVHVDLAGSLPPYDDNNDYITIGEVDVADVEGVLEISALRQAVTHSLRHGICGRTFDGPTILNPGEPYFWGV